ncbi:hypothetical protein GCM10023231_07350 [Olivibacter ginsenosidimutans]|uniref:Tetratricopeptide repeat protein n=2 Tax=Olivibacter ginsenosidimutans TaxID=1176537 RepID=A0ABP9AJB7_9SPHI
MPVKGRSFEAQHPTIIDIKDSLSTNQGFIGPINYILPPEKTSEQRLEEKYDKKHADADFLIRLFEERKLVSGLQQTGAAYPLPSSTLKGNFTFADLEHSFQQSLQAYLQLGNMEMVSNLQNRLGILQVENKTYDKAINSFQQALINKESLRDINGQLAICNNLALIYKFMGNAEQAYSYYNRINKLAVKSRNILSEVTALEQLALLKSRKGQYHEAEQDIIKRVLPLYKRLKDTHGRVGAYNNLAFVYLAQEKYTESRWFHLQAVKTASVNGGYTADLSYSLYHLGKVKKILKEYDLAISDYTKAASYAKQSGDEWLRMHIYDDLGDIYIQTKDYANATTYLEAYEDIKNKLIQASNQKEEITQTSKERREIAVLP